jgi:hypothetical protein
VNFASERKYDDIGGIFIIEMEEGNIQKSSCTFPVIARTTLEKKFGFSRIEGAILILIVRQQSGGLCNATIVYHW